jgi:hypothetical protein
MERLSHLSSIMPSPPSSAENNKKLVTLHVIYTTNEEERAILERIITVTSHFLIPTWLVSPIIGLYSLKVFTPLFI